MDSPDHDRRRIRPRYRHRGFGLVFASNVSWPELSPPETLSAADPVDVTLEWHAPSPLVLKEAELRVDGAVATIDVPETARYRITRSRVDVHPLPNAHPRTVRQFLLGPVLATVLHWRELVVLHGSAILWRDGSAVAFVGASGAGKSTFAHALTRRGDVALADDLVVVRVGVDGSGVVLPGGAHARLWHDALRRFGVSRDGLEQVAPDEDKFLVPHPRASDAPIPLSRVYQVSVAEGGAEATAVEAGVVQGMARLDVLDRHLYRRDFLAPLGVEAHHVRALLALASRVTVGYIRRTAGIDAVPRMIEWLETQP